MALSFAATLILAMSFSTAYAQPCTGATVAATLDPTQCLPVSIDASASANEDNWWIEIVEINTLGNPVWGNLFQGWFVGEQAGNISDLGTKTGYTFEHGKRYRIKVAVQNYHPAGGWCTPWHATGNMFVDIDDMATCYASSLLFHTWYDWQQECITHFEASTTYGNGMIDSVGFSLGSTTEMSTSPSHTFNMPTSGTFVGTVYATFYFSDGSQITISKSYQKCVTEVVDDQNGGPHRFAAPLTKGSVNVFPNPSKGNVTISNNFEENVHVELYSTTGQMVKSLDIEALSSSRVDLTEISAGIYIAKFMTAQGQVEERKIVIEQ